MQRATYSPVLIVEDDVRLCSVLARSLRGHGFRIHTAGTAATAREILCVEPVDAIVVDLGLPDESGWELIRWVRTVRGAKPRTIIMTATYQPVAPRSDSLPDVILHKPFAIETLIRHLQRPGGPTVTDSSSL
jgi:DNA-binding response OmpR family regulator